MYSTLLLDISGNLATITLNRPEKRNAISTQMMAELQTALDEIERSHALACLNEALARRDELSAQTDGEKRG